MECKTEIISSTNAKATADYRTTGKTRAGSQVEDAGDYKKEESNDHQHYFMRRTAPWNSSLLQGRPAGR